MAIYRFTMIVYTQEDSGSRMIPKLGHLTLDNVWVKGGAKRLFSRRDSKGQIELGAELQEMMTYKNLVCTRYSDSYSAELLEAFINRKKISLIVRFFAYGDKTRGRSFLSGVIDAVEEPDDLQSHTLLTASGVIADFDTFRGKSDTPQEKIIIKLKDPELTYF